MATTDNIPTITQLFKDHPERWNKGGNALNKWGSKTDARDDHAVRWCLFGASIKVYGRKSGPKSHPAIIQRLQVVVPVVAPHLCDTSVVGFNDSPTIYHRHVMLLLEKASKLAGFEI